LEDGKVMEDVLRSLIRRMGGSSNEESSTSDYMLYYKKITSHGVFFTARKIHYLYVLDAYFMQIKMDEEEYYIPDKVL
jgi:hypothetical protein